MGRAKKRTKSQVSPDPVSLYQTVKKQLLNGNDNQDQQHRSMATPQMHQPGYQGAQGMYYTPQPQAYMTQQSVSPIAYPASQPNMNFNQIILDKLEALDTRLGKLDSIDKQLHDMSQKLSLIDIQVSSLESTAKQTSIKIMEIESSRATESQFYDDISSKQAQLDKSMKEERDRVTKLSRDYESLKKINSSLSDDLTDLQARSMRDNLLFLA